MAASTSQELVQKKAIIQEDTDPSVAAELSEEVRGERSSGWHYRRSHRHTASHSLR